jgi:hypothetical protein
MCHVPAEWQVRLGAPALTGNGGVPIISRASYGPAIWGFDPNNINGDVNTIVPAELFVGYSGEHQTLGMYGNGKGSLYFNNVTHLTGIVFPFGSDTVLVFGSHGLGKNGDGVGCYGTGTATETLHGEPVGDGSYYCYDPVDSAKGTHAFPYISQVWAYNANDFLDVRSGVKKYWEIIPYAIWTINLPYANDTSTRTGKKVGVE